MLEQTKENQQDTKEYFDSNDIIIKSRDNRYISNERQISAALEIRELKEHLAQYERETHESEIAIQKICTHYKLFVRKQDYNYILSIFEQFDHCYFDSIIPVKKAIELISKYFINPKSLHALNEEFKRCLKQKEYFDITRIYKLTDKPLYYCESERKAS